MDRLKPAGVYATVGGGLFGSAALSPVIDRIFAFSDLRQALMRFRDAQHVGKIVIRMA
jgi:NADPH:quinone reductase-like Zn-dependent oxidoreductase